MTTDKTPVTLATVKPGGTVQLPKQEVGEVCSHEWRTTGGGSQARRPLVCVKCDQHRDHMPQQVGEVQGDGLAALAESWIARADEHEERAREAESIGGLNLAVALHEARASELLTAAKALKTALAARQPVGEGEDEQHPDSLAVDTFANSMKSKMTVSRWRGRSGWDDRSQCTQEALSQMLHTHVEKGDPVDVANFCMMLSLRGEVILPAPPAQAVDLGQFREAVEWARDNGSLSKIDGRNRLLALIDGKGVGK